MIDWNAIFRICSGQGRGKRTWSVCYQAPNRQWWRPEDGKGRVRRWASPEAAQRFCDTLSVVAVELDLARQAAAELREGYRIGGEAWVRGINRCTTFHAAYWGRDPAGLFTADIAHLSAIR